VNIDINLMCKEEDTSFHSVSSEELKNSRRPLGSGASRPSNGSSSREPGFFKDKKQTTSPFCISCADRLLKKCVETGMLNATTKYHTNKWALSFSRLVTEQGEEEVNLVLSWYLDHIGQDYIPEAYCGKTFRDKFDSIRRRMVKDPESCLARIKEQFPEGTITVEIEVPIANKPGHFRKELIKRKATKEDLR